MKTGDTMYILITGASSGIGKELAEMYAREKKNLILVARNIERLNQLKADLEKNDINVIVKPFDLSVPDNCYQLFSEVEDYEIDIFINNAGYGYLGNYDEIDLDIELNMLNLNILSVQILTKLYVKKYLKGTVVNLSSMAAFLPTPTFATYAASKAYVYNLSMAINYEMKRKKKDIKILTVAPGPVQTDFFNRAKANINRGMKVEKCAKIIKKGIAKKKSLIIPGIAMKLVYFLAKLVPNRVLLKASYYIQNKKY